jgi:hypothetical protein
MSKRKLKGEKEISCERVKELVRYDPKTGVFIFRQNRSNRLAGSMAGGKTKLGYILVRLDNCQIYAHRLAWFYVYGEWPPEQVDHINGVRDDNSLGNLRLASQSQNTCNGVLRRTNTSGYRGVSWVKEKKKWVAGLTKNGKQYKLGYFDDPKEAHMAYLDAARKLHGQFSKSD